MSGPHASRRRAGRLANAPARRRPSAGGGGARRRGGALARRPPRRRARGGDRARRARRRAAAGRAAPRGRAWRQPRDRRPRLRRSCASAGLVSSRERSGTVVRAVGRRGRAPGTQLPQLQRLLAPDEQHVDLAVAAPPLDELVAGIRVELGDAAGLVQPHGYDPAGNPGAARGDRRPPRPATGSTRVPRRSSITSGAHEALSLIAALFVGRGQPVALDAPTYPGALELFERAGGRPVTVAGDAAGMRPDALAAPARQTGRRAALPDAGLPQPDRRLDRARPPAGAAGGRRPARPARRRGRGARQAALRRAAAVAALARARSGCCGSARSTSWRGPGCASAGSSARARRSRA